MDPIEAKVASHGSADHARIVELCELLRAAVATNAPQPGDDEALHYQALVLTACAMFAGTVFGTMIAAGIVCEQDKRRAGEMMVRNFRSGIDVGKRRAMRLLGDIPPVGRA